ncbi:uncharacterized protein LOC129585629 [Paramacrobiotus metropolitanus]|uniref:uncharacterized protein LOC129585629 n=1 Tax=Paramacrobiotus metropolitanus TaxID=2943436 RepID=UPI002445744B|nr:uncharacterized protein LOC129585629 [Paramacrobiotus metropolitanus]
MAYAGDCLHGKHSQKIHRGQRIYSQNKALELVMQDDGNLVLYSRKDLRPLWASNTHGRNGVEAVMQSDGNFVVYAPGGHPIWASNTHGKHDCKLVLQNDANLVIYDCHNHPVWASNTHGQCPEHEQDILHPGEELLPGRSIHSKNGKLDLIMQTDGNLVLYRTSDGSPIWASNTCHKPVQKCVMQHDGNLVLYEHNGTPIWASNTYGQNGAELKVQDDGNLCMYKGHHCCWASGTHGRC